MNQKNQTEQNTEQKKSVRSEPIIETYVGISKDGKWIIHRTTITTLRPASYVAQLIHPKKKTKPTSGEDTDDEPEVFICPCHDDLPEKTIVDRLYDPDRDWL